MRTSEMLHKTADFIQVNGWGQGAGTWSGEGGYCVEGAMAAVAGWKMGPGVDGGYPAPDSRAKHACPAYKAVHSYLNKTPFVWNDDLNPITGQSEVIEVLRAAALIEETREKVAYATITLESQSQAVAV